MNPQELAIACAQLADGKKANDITILDIRPNSVADYFVLADGDSDVQVKAIADAVLRGARKQGQKLLGRAEGYDQAEWILLDFGDVIVHVFYNSTRLFYDLDGFWGDVPQVEWREANPTGQ